MQEALCRANVHSAVAAELSCRPHKKFTPNFALQTHMKLNGFFGRISVMPVRIDGMINGVGIPALCSKQP